METKMNEMIIKYYPSRLAIGERRVRTIFTDSQVEGLERTFEENKYPDYQILSDKFNVNIGRIKIWFQNKRARQPNKNSSGEESKHTPKSIKKRISPKLCIKPKPTFKADLSFRQATTEHQPSFAANHQSTLPAPCSSMPGSYSTPIYDVTSYIQTPTARPSSNYPFCPNSDSPGSSDNTPKLYSDVSSSSGYSEDASDSEDEYVDVCGFDDSEVTAPGTCGALDLRSDICKLRSIISNPPAPSASIIPIDRCDTAKSFNYNRFSPLCKPALDQQYAGKFQCWSPLWSYTSLGPSSPRLLPLSQTLPLMYQHRQSPRAHPLLRHTAAPLAGDLQRYASLNLPQHPYNSSL